MTLETAFDLPFWFEFAATVTGGLSGGMSAVRARYDIFGTVAIACITGMGGGIIRQTITDDDLRAIARDFGVTLNEKFLN